MLVFFVVFRLDVAVQVFFLVNGAGCTGGLLSVGGQLEPDLEPRRAQGHDRGRGRAREWAWSPNFDLETCWR
ncbi:hypothetical protein BC827DRAFT_1231528 [Russula dissimulans]|nr:hypothetical protein BC827DRAFT_1231528 [Russula dissimulans]